MPKPIESIQMSKTIQSVSKLIQSVPKPIDSERSVTQECNLKITVQQQ